MLTKERSQPCVTEDDQIFERVREIVAEKQRANGYPIAEPALEAPKPARKAGVGYGSFWRGGYAIRG